MKLINLQQKKTSTDRAGCTWTCCSIKKAHDDTAWVDRYHVNHAAGDAFANALQYDEHEHMKADLSLTSAM
jgi:hypothetical protein